MPGTNLINDGPAAPVAAESTLLPALRWGVAFQVRNDGVGVFSAGDIEYEFGGIQGYFLRDFITYLDGRHSRSSAVDSLGVPESVIKNVAAQLVQHGLAVELTEALNEEISHEQFSAVCRRHFPVWKERLFGHPLW